VRPPAAARGSSTLELPIDRAIYAVDRASRSYRYARRNPDWAQLDPADNERNKRSIVGYTRIFPDGRTRVFAYRAPYARPARAAGPAPELEPQLARLRTVVEALVGRVSRLPDAPSAGAWGARETLAHLVFWHEHYVATLAGLLGGRLPPQLSGTFTELNEQAVRRLGALPNRALTRRLLAAHSELEQLVRRPGAAGLAVTIKAGGKAWPMAAFLARVAGHVDGHDRQLRSRWRRLAHRGH
jgi:hypothetical protein